MAGTYTAILMDTVSIQDYIFSSNKLKDNIGASYIIEHKIKQIVLDELTKVNEETGFTNSIQWQHNPDKILLRDTGCKAEVGYIGGGKIMLMFRDKACATKLIQNVSLQLLASFPGVRTAFGIHENYDLGNFQGSQDELTKNLAYHKSIYYCNTTIPKHGITADCPLSNEAAEFTEVQERLQYISAVAKIKKDIAKTAHQELNEPLKGTSFLFPNKLDDLGQPDSRRYIAVVHVDGNNMGERFMACESLSQLRRLSAEVSEKCNKAVECLIHEVTQKFKDGVLSNGILIDEDFRLQEVKPVDKSTSSQWYLPIRPMIIAGDDITFVCEGRLGVYLAQRLITLLNESKDGKPISSCAGIAIVKAKYPFARAYRLAEELTLAAKAKSKKNGNVPYLDFLISASGFSGSLENIRNNNFKNAEGANLHFGPYRSDTENDERSFNHLTSALKSFTNAGNDWPKSKIMSLRNAVFAAESARKLFLEECKAIGRKLPKIKNTDYHDRIISGNGETPYFELIELMDFYPKILL